MTRAEPTPLECAAAACVANSVPGYRVAAMPDAPDADLEHDDGHHVGLEIVSVNEQRYLETRDRVEHASATVEKVLKDRAVRTFVTIYFDLDAMVEAERSTYRAWLRSLPEQILAHISSAPRGATRRPSLDAVGIERVAALEWEPSEVGGVGRGASWGLPPGETVVGNLLAKKHKRLRTYRAARAGEFREQWLAFASLGPGSLEDGGFEMLRARTYTTEFDRVFLIYRDSGGRFVSAEDVTPPRTT